jgi:hypothetical protein
MFKKMLLALLLVTLPMPPALAQKRVASKPIPEASKPTAAVQALLDRATKQTGDEKYRTIEQAFWKAETTHDMPGFANCVEAATRMCTDLHTSELQRDAMLSMLKSNSRREHPGRTAAWLYGRLVHRGVNAPRFTPRVVCPDRSI